MDKDYELKYHTIEENYWWFVARRNIILDLIKKSNLSLDAKILEIGCSGGALLNLLKNEGYTNLYGVDLSENAIQVCNDKGIKNCFVMDASTMNFENNEFDLVIASDILEHIDDDVSALNEWNRVTNINGTVIIFVPAFQSLWSSHDDINHHYRRYSKKLFMTRIKNSGLKISKISYWNFTLFFPSFFIRNFQRIYKSKKQSNDQLYEINSFFNKTLIGLLKFENFHLKFSSFPLGVSLFSVAVKSKVD